MNWISTLSTPGWIALLAIPPLIVALYFLKLRRRPVQVPSTYLWKKTIEDMHVNSLWQRLRNNLLMLLQILLVLFLILACLRPGCSGVKLDGDRFVFLIDQSASMAATDLPEVTRLEEVKRQVEIMINRMDPTDAAMLISFSNQAEVVQSYTTNKNVLIKKLNAIPQTQRATQLRDALVAAAGLANPGRTATEAGDYQVADARPAMLHIFSDGKFPDVTDFSLGNLTPIYHSIGSFEPPTNVGITAFAINDDPNVSEKREAFAQIKNASPESQTIDATLYVDDKLFDAQANVAIPAGRSAGISFPLTGLFQNLEQATKIRLVVTPDDALAQDNTAFAVVNPPRLAQILVVTPGNDFLRLALATEPILKMANVQFRERDFLTDREFEKRALLGEYDLIVFDQCQPGSMPNCSTLFIGMPPPGEQWKFGDPQFPTPIIDFFRTHPLMTSLQLASVSILEGAAITGPAGTQSLIDSVYGSVMAIAPRGGYQDLVMSFTLQTFTDEGTQVNTDWPSQLSFPLFIQNVVSNLAGGSRFLTIESVAPGQPTRLRPSPTVTKIGVSTPAGRRIELTRDKSNSFLFSQTDRVGIYSLETLESSGATPPAKQLFAVNLFDPQETDITVRDELEIGFDPVKATTDVLPSRTEFWKWAVIAALAVLLIEWYVYNRRVLI